MLCLSVAQSYASSLACFCQDGAMIIHFIVSAEREARMEDQKLHFSSYSVSHFSFAIRTSGPVCAQWIQIRECGSSSCEELNLSFALRQFFGEIEVHMNISSCSCFLLLVFPLIPQAPSGLFILEAYRKGSKRTAQHIATSDKVLHIAFSWWRQKAKTKANVWGSPLSSPFLDGQSKDD